jgi:Na+/proline symporter
MSDIGILNDPLSVALIMALFGAPGLVAGVILGAIVWRSHRRWGALIGGTAGFALSLMAFLRDWW